LFRIWVFLNSTVCPSVGYLVLYISWFSSVPPGKFFDNTLTIAPTTCQCRQIVL